MRLVFGLTGQSNMTGDAPMPAVPPTYANADRIYDFSTGVWKFATDPLVAGWGVGPGIAFADNLLTLLGDPAYEIGLINTSVPGSSSTQWQPTWLASGAHYYALALKLFQASRAWGTFAGIIDYQGETDAADLNLVWPWIQNKRGMVLGFRQDMNLLNLPVILTRLGLTYNPPGSPGRTAIQQMLDITQAVAPANVYVVSASDLPGGWGPDGTDVGHLPPSSQLILGQRYAAKMFSILQ